MRNRKNIRNHQKFYLATGFRPDFVRSCRKAAINLASGFQPDVTNYGDKSPGQVEILQKSISLSTGPR